jgi:hypothetical protein
MIALVGRRPAVAALAIIAVVSSIADRAYAAGAAYQVDTAEVSSPGSCKVESWVSFASNGDRFAAASPSCVVDFGHPVELSAQFARSRSDGEWATAVTPKMKFNIVPSAIGSWGVALAATAAYDFTARETTGYTVTVPATLRLSNVVRINANAGWFYDRVAQQHYFSYGLGFDWRTPDNVWTLTGEVFGIAGAAEDRSTVEPRFQLGLRYRPVDKFNVDLIYGRNITGENAHWLTIASIVRFSAGEK